MGLFDPKSMNCLIIDEICRKSPFPLAFGLPSCISHKQGRVGKAIQFSRENVDMETRLQKLFTHLAQTNQNYCSSFCSALRGYHLRNISRLPVVVKD